VIAGYSPGAAKRIEIISTDIIWNG